MQVPVSAEAAAAPPVAAAPAAAAAAPSSAGRGGGDGATVRSLGLKLPAGVTALQRCLLPVSASGIVDLKLI